MAQGVAGTGPNANPDLAKVVKGRKTKLTRSDILKLAKDGGRSAKKAPAKKAAKKKKATKAVKPAKPVEAKKDA